MSVHLWSGTGVLALLIFRLGWGLVGSTTSRFSHFVKGPRSVIRYLMSLNRFEYGHPVSYVGHNPAGGWMVVVLITVLSAQVTTGLFANNGVRFNGPLALWISQDRSDLVTEWHSYIFNFLLFLIWCHLVAVFFYRFVKGEDLILPMITGQKHEDGVPAKSRVLFARPVLAAVLFASSAVLAWWIV